MGEKFTEVEEYVVKHRRRYRIEITDKPVAARCSRCNKRSTKGIRTIEEGHSIAEVEVCFCGECAAEIGELLTI